MLHNIPEERRSHLHRGGSLKSRMKHLVKSFSPVSWFFLPLKYLPQPLIFEHPQPVLLHYYRDRVSCTYKMTGRITVLNLIFVLKKNKNSGPNGSRHFLNLICFWLENCTILDYDTASTCCIITQKSAVLICFAVEAWNHSYALDFFICAV
jgi:hypothetical protein